MPEELTAKLHNIFEQVRENKEMNETKLRRIFDKQGILELLGYSEDDVSVEANIEGNRADYHCRDEYDNVVVVWEFKKPSKTNLSDYLSQLWDLYVSPLKADYGVLFNGLQIILFERINSNYNKIFSSDIADIGPSRTNQLLNLEKPDYSTKNLEEIKAYFNKFRPPKEKITLQEEKSREHFYKIFRLTKGSVFENLLLQMVKLFEKQYESHEKDKFITSAYDFWRQSYARKPEKVPSLWKDVMEKAGLKISKKENLFKFMFCLETAYALFTRLILAKACEDYEFPGINFSKFIERKVKELAWREMEISKAAWAVLTKQLIDSLRAQLVESIFEEDIFYWWTTAFEKLEEDPYTGTDRETLLFGGAIAKLLFAVYKFDFSKIVGDPLGNLYQRYFDKKTRKALGEFYTPQEVVNCIENAVTYNGYKILDKRLLDPGCGSGTFLVTALHQYLKEAERRVELNSSWTKELKNLCNGYRIVGFDIHPFATIMAQIQFMLVLLPYYKKAMEEETRFVLKRVPIFRTDSLINERKSGNIDLQSFGEERLQSIKMPLKLPIYTEEEEDFLTIELVIPAKSAVIKHQVDILNTEEYFKALQALFDTVKEDAKEESYSFSRDKFEINLKHYLENKKWSQIGRFFFPYGNNILETIRKLKYEYGDGRLVKSIEDLLLASVLKNEQKYDYVVGNPPYVRIQNLSEIQKKYYKSNYDSSTGNYDLYCLFIERGLEWLKEEGKLGFITPNQFQKNSYGRGVRNVILSESTIEQILDFQDSQVFPDATNYPQIIILRKGKTENHHIRVMRASRLVRKRDITGTEFMEKLRDYSTQECFSNELLDVFYYPQNRLNTDLWYLMPKKERKVFDKILTNSKKRLKDITEAIFQGVRTSKNSFYIVSVGKKGKFILSKDGGKEVEVEPTGHSGIYTIETDLLRPFVQGKEIQKWHAHWSGLYLLHPYTRGVNPHLISQKDIKESLPKTWEYFNDYKEELENRESGRMKNRDDWYGYIYPKNLDKFEKPKIMGANIVSESRFVYDPGKLYFTAGYGIKLKPNFEEETAVTTAILNSRLGNFILKHIADIKMGGYYAFESQYLSKLPIKFAEKESERIREKVGEIQDILNQKILVSDFQRYSTEKSETEMSVINIKMNSGHSNVSPSINSTEDEMFAVVMGERKKENPIVVSTLEKARFVKLALEGKDVKKGEKIEIFVPKSNSVVKEILDKYDRDKKKLEEMPSVEELEKEINQIVYDLYGLDEDDIAIIENFLEKF